MQCWRQADGIIRASARFVPCDFRTRRRHGFRHRARGPPGPFPVEVYSGGEGCREGGRESFPPGATAEGAPAEGIAVVVGMKTTAGRGGLQPGHVVQKRNCLSDAPNLPGIRRWASRVHHHAVPETGRGPRVVPVEGWMVAGDRAPDSPEREICREMGLEPERDEVPTTDAYARKRYPIRSSGISRIPLHGHHWQTQSKRRFSTEEIWPYEATAPYCELGDVSSSSRLFQCTFSQEIECSQEDRRTARHHSSRNNGDAASIAIKAPPYASRPPTLPMAFLLR